MKKELRIFLTSSQLSTAFYSAYANKTGSTTNFHDVLIIDRAPKKKSLVKNILERAAIFHSWNDVIDLSISLENTYNTKPSLRKKITRKIKSLPVFKVFYNILLSRYDNKLNQKNIHLLNSSLHIDSDFQVVSLHLLTQTLLNKALIEKFPRAKLHFFEHGTGDYFYVLRTNLKFDYFHCFFFNSFSDYIKKNNYQFRVSSYLSKADFENIFSLSANDKLKLYFDNLFDHSTLDLHLILLDAFEIYHPPANFWTDYLEKIISTDLDSTSALFVLKPHPNQSKESILVSAQFFRDRGFKFLLLDDAEISQLSVETFYLINKNRIKAVYSTFSSALFYLAFYYSENSRFFMLYDFASKYINAAPAQYKEIFKGLRPLIDEVFDSKKIINRL